MLLETINVDPRKAYVHMERYVNNGSPSGFSEKYTTSLQTRATGPNEHFYLCSIEVPSEITIHNFGSQPRFFENWEMLVHPDMIDEPLFSKCLNVNKQAAMVAPTASSRTVIMLDTEGWFLKLNYKGLIGRFERQIGRKQALSAIEVSRVISRAIENKTLPKSFYFMREVFSRVLSLPDDASFYEWGIVLREPGPFPANDQIEVLIPAFSLFSEDARSPSDPPILVQLIQNQTKRAADFLFEDVISPIYEAYFGLLLRCGLQLEGHAQNCLFAVDKDFKMLGFVAKDSESIDKDLSLINELKLEIEFDSLDWKCLSEDQYNYQIMHSFMFDFKLGEYLITPIIKSAAQHFSLDKRKLISRIRSFNDVFIRDLPSDFFPPDGKWYSYANIVHDRTKKRPYLAKANPKYRSVRRG